MTAVTVDLADLETLVITAGAIKTIEGVLATRRDDPFVRPHLDFTAAHDRLASAVRNATRAEAGTLVNFDAPLTKTEARLLTGIRFAIEGRAARKDGVNLPWFRLSGPDKADGEYESLAAKGCIRMGQAVTGAIFAGDKQATIVPDADRGYLVELTDRGRAMLTAFEAASKPSTVLGAG